jgi:hypothetical protein
MPSAKPDVQTVLQNAFGRFRMYGNYSNNLELDPTFIADMASEIETDNIDDSIALAAKLMYRIVERDPVHIKRERVLNMPGYMPSAYSEDKYKQASKAFAVHFGLFKKNTYPTPIIHMFSHRSSKQLTSCGLSVARHYIPNLPQDILAAVGKSPDESLSALHEQRPEQQGN